MYPPLSGKPWIRAKRPLHMDQVKLRLRRQAWPQKIVCTQEDLNLKSNENATKTKALSTFKPTPWSLVIYFKEKNNKLRA